MQIIILCIIYTSYIRDKYMKYEKCNFGDAQIGGNYFSHSPVRMS